MHVDRIALVITRETLAQDVDEILPLTIFELEWLYFNPFWNAALPNEPINPNFALKLVAMATSLEESEKWSRSITAYKYLSVCVCVMCVHHRHKPVFY